jgi:hypothetical protein
MITYIYKNSEFFTTIWNIFVSALIIKYLMFQIVITTIWNINKQSLQLVYKQNS